MIHHAAITDQEQTGFACPEVHEGTLAAGGTFTLYFRRGAAHLDVTVGNRAAEGSIAREDGGPEGELRLVLPYLRDPLLCNWDHAVAHALADWLERTANDMSGLVKLDAPECPNCGEGCGGHPEALFCDRCCEAVESQHYAPCRCWTEALRTARALAISFGLASRPAE
jgi:hypothetical protein